MIIGVIIIIVALTVMAYPSFVLYINERYSTSEIDDYNNIVDTLSDEDKEKLLEEAKDYNDDLKESGLTGDFDDEAVVDGYNDVLSFDDGIIGYVQIPCIDLNLPIYHGTDSEYALSKGAAHHPNTAFPVGGLGNHCVLSGHTAYRNQIFFDNIHKLEPGDKIYIIILNDKYSYTVTKHTIIDPDDTSVLQVINKKDLLSLVTCWPYAQNTHRYVVTAERDRESETSEESSHPSTESIEDDLITAVLKGKKDKLAEHEIILLVYVISVLICILLLLFIIAKSIVIQIIKIVNRRKQKAP